MGKRTRKVELCLSRKDACQVRAEHSPGKNEEHGKSVVTGITDKQHQD